MMCDAKGRLLSYDIPREVFKALSTHDGGEANRLE
jgi:hypothetical protein